MKYLETAAEIEKEIQKLNEAKRIRRVSILCRYYHVNPCIKNNCNSCKFIIEYRNLFLSNYNQKTSEEMISYFVQCCRQNTMIFILCLCFYNLLQQLKKKG